MLFALRRYFCKSSYLSISEKIFFRENTSRLCRLVDYVLSDHAKKKSTTNSAAAMSALQQMYRNILQKEKSLNELTQLISDVRADSPEKIDLEQQHAAELEDLIDLEEKIIDHLLFQEYRDSEDELLLEIAPGVGGTEASLFAAELLQMYCQFAESKRWTVESLHIGQCEKGGIRSASVAIVGQGCLNFFQYEGGVHRVQRVPVTERYGRIHTSTATVTVLPVPRDSKTEDVNLKDIKVHTFRSSSKGGQNVNKIESAVRLTHIPSGIQVECQVERSQEMNKKKAMQRLIALIHEQNKQKLQSEVDRKRKLQVGTAARSEKIRTYNFHDDRVTDHRLKKDFHRVNDIMQGISLEPILLALRHFDREDRLQIMIQMMETSEKQRQLSNGKAGKQLFVPKRSFAVFFASKLKRKRFLKAEVQKHIPLWQIPPGRLFCERHAFLTLEGVGEVENASNKLGTCFTNGVWPHDSLMTALWNISAYFLHLFTFDDIRQHLHLVIFHLSIYICTINLDVWFVNLKCSSTVGNC
ncbi:Peptide chain release factor 1 [Trichinella zimbabwensis]|uniref:Peptide chain release factor 1 n=1 Tax=Trichinella zimbabwensis TaxID=268475 RepID=A0A0V1HCV1_9BILA|nr:Peptide chain release factor 1 [Trichinella zimbabwensis]